MAIHDRDQKHATPPEGSTKSPETRAAGLKVGAGVFRVLLREMPRDSPYPSGSASIAFVAEATNRDCLEMDGTGA